MLNRRFGPLAASLTLVVALMLSAVGCSDTATTPRNSYTQDEVTLLYRGAPNAKPAEGEEATIEDSTEVSELTGAMLDVGDDAIGISSLDVPPDAIEPEEDGSIVKLTKMKVNRIGEVSAILGPAGKRFKRPIIFTLSYKGADLGGIDESNLVIMYLNEDIGVWEVVDGSVVDTQKKRVSAPLTHFSRYGIGGDE